MRPVSKQACPGTPTLWIEKAMRPCYAPLFLAATICATAAHAAGDADVLALIDALRSTALAITVDGDLSDWGEIPFFDDPAGDAGPDPGLDITSFAIAPVSDGILFAATTVGELPALGSFVVGLDFARGPRQDFEIDIDATGSVHTVTIFDPLGVFDSFSTITGLELAIGSQSIEIRIPNSALAAALPTELAAALNPAVHRSWVRGGMSSESPPGTTVDDVTGVGSFRLIATPLALDPPLPTGIENAGEAPVVLEFPLEGRWFLGQGANGDFTHGGAWSYDLIVLDDELRPSFPDMSFDNYDYFAFGQPFFAPASGTVTFAIGTNPDNTPFTPGPVNNEVQIDIGGGHSVRLLHAKQNTTLVSPSEIVDLSAQIAEVGNSGFSFQAHLHMDVLEASATHPLAFRDVDIALNPVDDPWLRHIASWEPREGFFVTAVPEPSATILAVAAIAGIALLRRVAPSRRRPPPATGPSRPR